MEKMPYQDKLCGALPYDWHFGLPPFVGEHVTLRELCISDAAALLAMLSSDEVAEFISPLPHTVDGFADFITEAQ